MKMNLKKELDEIVFSLKKLTLFIENTEGLIGAYADHLLPGMEKSIIQLTDVEFLSIFSKYEVNSEIYETDNVLFTIYRGVSIFCLQQKQGFES